MRLGFLFSVRTFFQLVSCGMESYVILTYGNLNK